jgi:hypothetical protein
MTETDINAKVADVEAEAAKVEAVEPTSTAANNDEQQLKQNHDDDDDDDQEQQKQQSPLQQQQQQYQQQRHCRCIVISENSFLRNKWLQLGMLILLLVAGIVLLLFSEQDAYLCGSDAPTSTTTTLPMCYRTTTFKDGPLCLRASTVSSTSTSPEWCYERRTQLTEVETYYLWWSPCTSCGPPSWRMWDTMDDINKSKYKTSNNDTSTTTLNSTTESTTALTVPSSLPDNDDWLQWNSSTSQWDDTNPSVTLEECDVAVDCYQEMILVQYFIPGLLILLLVGVFFIVWTCYHCSCCHGDGRGTHETAAADDYGNSNYGAYDGGDGGGDDGGGGGGGDNDGGC